jgi:hypothetical protein
MMTAFPWSSFTLMPMNSVVLPMCTNLSLGLWWFILLGDDAAVGSPS